jgi:hypothetical protein
MRGLVALAGAAAAIAGFGFTSGYADTEAWTQTTGKVCDGYNIVPYSHPRDDVKAASCYAKCEAGDTASCAVAATPDSATIFLGMAACGKLCWSLDECQSYDQSDGGNVCYLNTWDCAAVITSGLLTTSPGYSLYSKQVPWQAESAVRCLWTLPAVTMVSIPRSFRRKMTTTCSSERMGCSA